MQENYSGATGKEMLKGLRSKVLATSIDSLCRNYPKQFADYLKYCRCLGFDEQPDYAYLRQMFTDLFQCKGEWTHAFDL